MYVGMYVRVFHINMEKIKGGIFLDFDIARFYMKIEWNSWLIETKKLLEVAHLRQFFRIGIMLKSSIQS